tara:strand:+ start:241 stop:519 length:279 start_codon:yes stop_codon:yes gene_type:complete
MYGKFSDGTGTSAYINEHGNSDIKSFNNNMITRCTARIGASVSALTERNLFIEQKTAELRQIDAEEARFVASTNSDAIKDAREIMSSLSLNA